MISRTAEHTIDENSVWFKDDGKTQSLWVRAYIANEAINIAEDEILDRTKKAYCKSCYFSTTCENKFNDNCSFLKEFVKELNK